MLVNAELRAEWGADIIVDADSHWSEPPDLFISRAPAALKDRVPRVEDVDGTLMWVFDGRMYPNPRKILGENARELYRL